MMEENEEMIETPTATAEKKPNNMMAIGAIVLISVAVLGYTLLNKGGSIEESKEVPSTTTTPVVEGASSSASVSTENGMTTITMDAGAFYYKPNQITVKKGTKVKVILTSRDMMHDFNIDELQVKSGIAKSGETKTVEFIAEKVGSFEYYCSVGQHRKNGQVGTLVVTE